MANHSSNKPSIHLLPRNLKIVSVQGFSLIELMVVVAIIGILATIAIPNFQRFQARSRQSSAKTELAAIFTAQKAFFASQQTYHPNLPMIGFRPEGIQDGGTGQYQAVSTANRVYASGSGECTTLWATTAATCTGEMRGGTATSPLGITVDAANYRWYGYWPANRRLCNFDGIGVTNDGLVTGQSSVINTLTATITQNTFIAGVLGCPRSSDQDPRDTWTINELRDLQNTVSGI